MHTATRLPKRTLPGLSGPLARALASAALMAACATAAQAQQASSIVIQGKDNWLFPGWARTPKPQALPGPQPIFSRSTG